MDPFQRPALSWRMIWTDGQEYGSAVYLPDDIKVLPLIDRLVDGKRDSAELVGEYMGLSVAGTIRSLSGVDDTQPLDWREVNRRVTERSRSLARTSKRPSFWKRLFR